MNNFEKWRELHLDITDGSEIFDAGHRIGAASRDVEVAALRESLARAIEFMPEALPLYKECRRLLATARAELAAATKPDWSPADYIVPDNRI